MTNTSQIKITIIFFLALILGGCKKESTSSATLSKKIAIRKSLMTSGNPEAHRLYELYTNMDYQIAINATANYGHSHGRQTANYDIQAAIPSNFPSYSIELPVGSYDLNSTTNTGAGLKGIVKEDNFSSLFGRDVTIKLHDGASIFEQRIYAPREIKVQKLGMDSQNIQINRSGNVLQWSPDPQNTAGVLIEYKLYNSNDITDPMRIYESNMIFAPDNGAYNLDGILSNSTTKGIAFTIYRANAVNYRNGDNKNILISFVSMDIHLYSIVN